MRTRVLLLAVLVTAAVTACAPLQTSRMAQLDCNTTPQCRVQVFVDCPFFCGIVVEYDKVVGKRNGDIVWELQNKPNQSYAFDRTNGIVFPSAPSVFDCHVEANGLRFTCKNRGDKGEYKYTVNLSGLPTVTPLDPWVVNN